MHWRIRYAAYQPLTVHDQSHHFTHRVPIAPHAGVQESKAQRNQKAESREQRADNKQRAGSKEQRGRSTKRAASITWCRVAGDLQVGSGNWTDCYNTIPHTSTCATTAAVSASWALHPGSMTGGQAHAMPTVNVAIVMVGMRRLVVFEFYSDHPLPSKHRRGCRTAKLPDGGHEDTSSYACRWESLDSCIKASPRLSCEILEHVSC